MSAVRGKMQVCKLIHGHNTGQNSIKGQLGSSIIRNKEWKHWMHGKQVLNSTTIMCYAKTQDDIKWATNQELTGEHNRKTNQRQVKVNDRTEMKTNTSTWHLLPWEPWHKAENNDICAICSLYVIMLNVCSKTQAGYCSLHSMFSFILRLSCCHWFVALLCLPVLCKVLD